MKKKRFQKDLLGSAIFSAVFLFCTLFLGYIGSFFWYPGTLIVHPFRPEQICGKGLDIEKYQEEQLKLLDKMDEVPYGSAEWQQYYDQRQPILDDLEKAQNSYRQCTVNWDGTHLPRVFYNYIEAAIDFLFYFLLALIVIRLVRLASKDQKNHV